MRPLKTFAAAILVATATPLAGGHFSKTVPPPIPSVAGWERIAGVLDFESPRVTVQYEFYVNPVRPATYEVVRYRVTDLGPQRADRTRYPATEKLQWDRDGRDLRRFECVFDAARTTPCAWLEMDKGGADYNREVPLLIWLYDAHNKASKGQ